MVFSEITYLSEPRSMAHRGAPSSSGPFISCVGQEAFSRIFRLFVAFLSFFVFPWPSPLRVINVFIIGTKLHPGRMFLASGATGTSHKRGPDLWWLSTYTRRSCQLSIFEEMKLQGPLTNEGPTCLVAAICLDCQESQLLVFEERQGRLGSEAEPCEDPKCLVAAFNLST